MTATKTQLTGGVFQDAEGNVLNLGYLILKLNQDNSVTGVGNICAGIEIKILLNSSGSVSTSPAQYIWATDVLVTTNAFYTVTGYTAQGQIAWGPNNQQVTSGGVGGGTFDVGLWVPGSVFSWTPPNQPVSLQTNGVPNASQIVENLKAGSNITLTADGSGGTTIAAATPAGVTLQTNGTPNSSQTLLNLASGSGIAVSEAAGTVTIAQSGVVIPAGLSIVPMVGNPPGLSATATASIGTGTTTHVISGRQIINQATAFKIAVTVSVGNIVLGNSVILKCTRDTGTVVSSTAVTFGGSASPTWTPGLNTSDAIALTLDREHDYYIMWYVTANSGLVNLYQETTGNTFAGGYKSGVSGNKTTDNPVTLSGTLGGGLTSTGSCLLTDFVSA